MKGERSGWLPRRKVRPDEADFPDYSDRSFTRYRSYWQAGISWELPLGRLLIAGWLSPRRVSLCESIVAERFLQNEIEGRDSPLPTHQSLLAAHVWPHQGHEEPRRPSWARAKPRSLYSGCRSPSRARATKKKTSSSGET